MCSLATASTARLHRVPSTALKVMLPFLIQRGSRFAAEEDRLHKRRTPRPEIDPVSGIRKTILARMFQKDDERYDLRFLADAKEPIPGGFKAEEWLRTFDPTADATDVIANTSRMAAMTPYGEKTLVNSEMPDWCHYHTLGPIRITTVTSLDAGVSRYHAAQIAKMRRGGLQKAYCEVGSSPLHPDGREPVVAATYLVEPHDQSVLTWSFDLSITSFPQNSRPSTATHFDRSGPLSSWPTDVRSGSAF